MIAPLPDRAPADDASVRSIPDADAAATAAMGGVRFADLLARPPTVAAPAPTADPGASAAVRPEPPVAIADPHVPVPPGASARLFNQDGFFGAALAETPAVPMTGEVAAETPLAEMPATMPREPFERAALHVGAPTVGAGRSKADAAVVVPQPRRATAGPIARQRTTGSVATADRPGKVAGSPARAAPRPVPAPRRAPPPPNTSVAVAVHALAHGMEVVARVADLDPVERSALAEEIAALLSSHGYAPARIGVAAVLPARREPR